MSVLIMLLSISLSDSPGPVAPLHWIKSCVQSLVPDESSPNRKKILVGINFYGYDFTSSAMEGMYVLCANVCMPYVYSQIFPLIVYLYTHCTAPLLHTL